MAVKPTPARSLAYAPPPERGIYYFIKKRRVIARLAFNC